MPFTDLDLHEGLQLLMMSTLSIYDVHTFGKEDF